MTKLLIFSLLILAGCGGAASDSVSPPTAPNINGVYNLVNAQDPQAVMDGTFVYGQLVPIAGQITLSDSQTFVLRVTTQALALLPCYAPGPCGGLVPPNPESVTTGTYSVTNTDDFSVKNLHFTVNDGTRSSFDSSLEFLCANNGVMSMNTSLDLIFSRPCS